MFGQADMPELLLITAAAQNMSGPAARAGPARVVPEAPVVRAAR